MAASLTVTSGRCPCGGWSRRGPEWSRRRRGGRLLGASTGAAGPVVAAGHGDDAASVRRRSSQSQYRERGAGLQPLSSARVAGSDLLDGQASILHFQKTIEGQKLDGRLAAFGGPDRSHLLEGTHENIFPSSNFRSCRFQHGFNRGLDELWQHDLDLDLGKDLDLVFAWPGGRSWCVPSGGRIPSPRPPSCPGADFLE